MCGEWFFIVNVNLMILGGSVIFKLCDEGWFYCFVICDELVLVSF